MQLALRPCAAAGVTVIIAGLIHVTPVTAHRVEHRAVDLAAAGDLLDLLDPVDTGLSTLTGVGGPALASLSDALPSAADLQLLDPAFWELFWFELTDPDAGSAAELLLVGAIEQLPVVGPLLVGFGVGLFWVSLVAADGWSELSQIFGFEPSAAAATEGFGAGVQGVYDAALTGLIDPASPAGVSAALADITAILDLNPVAEAATAFDPAALVDVGTVVDAGSIADLGGVLTNLIP